MSGIFTNEYPYTDFHQLNLSWLIKELTTVKETVEQFVSINALKYADPIQWNITTQYEKNTIVIDPQTGTAYISVDPVPSGVALSNTDYWTVVFDLGSFVVRAAKNFTSRYEEETTTTATFPTNIGEWLVWGDTLYRAKVNITAGDAYVVDSNIEQITVEEIKNEIMSAMDALYTEISDRVGDLADLTTSDITSIVNAINSIITERGSLANLTTSDITSIVDAINSIITERGSLAALNTSDKTSIVNAINSEVTRVNNQLAIVNYDILDIRRYGGVADGTTDNSAAFALCMAENNGVYLPAVGTYYFASTITLYDDQFIIGDAAQTHLSYDHTLSSFIDISGANIAIRNLWIEGENTDTNTTVIIKFRTDLNNVIEHICISNIWCMWSYLVASDAGNSYDSMLWHPMFIYFENVNARFARLGGFRFGTIEGFLFMKNCAVLFQGTNQGANGIGFDFTRLSGGIFESCEVLGDLSNSIAKTAFQFINCAALWISRAMVDYNYGTQGIRLSSCDAVYIEWSVVSVSDCIGVLVLNSSHVQIVNCYFNGRYQLADFPSNQAAIWAENCFLNISGCMFNKYRNAVYGINNGNAAHINMNGCQIQGGAFTYIDTTNNLVFITSSMADDDSINISATSPLLKYQIYNSDTGALSTNI